MGQIFFALQSVRITHRREDFFLQKAKNERKGLCPQNTQMDADEEFLFRIYVNRRVLRASLDSIAAGRAVSLRLRVFALKSACLGGDLKWLAHLDLVLPACL
jgi:hypothetical protein